MSKSTPSLLLCTLFCVVSSLILICLSSAAGAAANDVLIENQSQSTAAAGPADRTGIDALELKLNELLSLNRKLESRLEKLEENSVPLGFVYIQLPNQYAPDMIWPGVAWMEVTREYQGLFFRAEGGGSAEFGLIQEDSTRQIAIVQCETSYGSYPFGIDVPKTGWSEVVFTGFHTSGTTDYYNGLRFSTSEVEVRPKNTAVRIWKRIL